MNFLNSNLVITEDGERLILASFMLAALLLHRPWRLLTLVALCLTDRLRNQGFADSPDFQ